MIATVVRTPQLRPGDVIFGRDRLPWVVIQVVRLDKMYRVLSTFKGCALDVEYSADWVFNIERI